jgi:mannose-6-phosphate isomerase-like protein (cupin superfamily)
VHISPSSLRTVSRGGLVIRYASLGPVLFTVGDIGESGTRGTSLEEICTTPHWFVSLRGELEVVPVEGEALHLSPGQAAYIPGGAPGHRFHADGPVTAAGFAPQPPRAIEEAEIRAAGFVVERSADLWVPDEQREIALIGGGPAIVLRRGQIHADAALMGPWVACGARFGSTAGYRTSWCDMPHWGLVLAGSMAIDWEDDVELVRAGDAYHCPAGPPGHRFEVPDAVTIVDFTPLEDVAAGGRSATWRPSPAVTLPT